MTVYRSWSPERVDGMCHQCSGLEVKVTIDRKIEDLLYYFFTYSRAFSKYRLIYLTRLKFSNRTT